MLKLGHSRLMALGDFKQTWRDDKTTCGVFSAKCQESPHLQVGEYVKRKICNCLGIVILGSGIYVNQRANPHYHQRFI